MNDASAITTRNVEDDLSSTSGSTSKDKTPEGQRRAIEWVAHGPYATLPLLQSLAQDTSKALTLEEQRRSLIEP